MRWILLGMTLLIGVQATAQEASERSFEQLLTAIRAADETAVSGAQQHDVSECVFELESRMHERRLTSVQIGAFLDACFGDEAAKPLSQLWGAKYELVLSAYYRTYSVVREQERLALDAPAAIWTTAGEFLAGRRDHWPSGVIVPIGIRVHTAWRPSLGDRVRVTVELAGAVQVEGITAHDIYVPIPAHVTSDPKLARSRIREAGRPCESAAIVGRIPRALDQSFGIC